ncbi:LysR family transcriptional regulator [Paeniglutamicibacter sp. ZC-3]|uniref:LysR substrate-binding domain-containing protein n=1 Tax=Paeniglutamicibacter sp. ZC-3 TaxID=2986919 RepID=UPI0021F7E2AA|nr:LysR family transcriptional regulator [Paeniglutamicibacter sp. ZC-3]MCV9993334.1 LysR family transcriptional regulator [Paeniglutamicibacter sp. ZC-3]
MDLRQVEYFLAVARTRSFTDAAGELFVSQPAVSHAVRRLESELGVRLLERTSTGVNLSDAGRLFQDRAQRILAEVEQTQTAMRAHLSPAMENIRIGVPPMMGPEVIPELMMLDRSETTFDVSIVETGSVAIAEKILAQELDLGLVVRGTFDARFEFNPLGFVTVNLGVAPSHPFAQLESVHFSQLEAEPLVLMDSSSLIREIILARFAAVGIEPNILLESKQLFTTARLVAAGLGTSFFSATAAPHLPGITMVPVVPAVQPPVGILRRRAAVNTPAQDIILELIRRHFTPLPGTGPAAR